MRALFRSLLILATSCVTHVPAPAKKQAVCISHEVRVVDEANQPLAGARVHTTMTYRQFGPSMLPEGSHMEVEESPVVTTGADGKATVCKLDLFREGTLEVEYREWPRAKRPWHEREVTLGPPRAALVQVPDSPECPDPKQLQVVAYASPLAADTVTGTQRPARSFTLTNLGPWRYWVRSTGCGTIAMRILDGSDIPPTLMMDRNDGAVLFRDFAGGTATVTTTDDATPVATATLSDAGAAAIPLPGSVGTVYCLMLVKDDRCVVTFTRAGEVATPGLYDQRKDFLERCPVCPAAQ